MHRGVQQELRRAPDDWEPDQHTAVYRALQVQPPQQPVRSQSQPTLALQTQLWEDVLPLPPAISRKISTPRSATETPSAPRSSCTPRGTTPRDGGAFRF
jgi:hypothetical protein